MTKWQRDLKKCISSEGYTVVNVEKAAKHHKFILQKDGIQFMVFSSCTPAEEGRALMQFRQDTKRQYRLMKEKLDK